MNGKELLNFANKLEDDNKDKGYKWLYDKLRYEIIKKHQEAINYTRCSTELNTSFKKGDKVIACNKLEGTVVSSETRTMVKVKIKGTTIGINARSLELKSI